MHANGTKADVPLPCNVSMCQRQKWHGTGNGFGGMALLTVAMVTVLPGTGDCGTGDSFDGMALVTVALALVTWGGHMHW